MKTKKNKNIISAMGTGFFSILCLLYVFPIFVIVINAFKKKVYINDQPFSMPNAETYTGFKNFMEAINKYKFIEAVGWTVFITVASVAVILLCTSMCAWYITRVKSKFSKIMYFLCVFSMVVPFQMVMFTLSLIANRMRLNTPFGLIIVYLGFGAGLAVFMFCGFVKSIPVEIEEAAMIDGCTPLQTFFLVVLPIMKPTYISVGILETMWIWNDFLLPYLVLDVKKYRTISMAIQYMRGSYGRVDMGAIMATLVMAVIPVIVFYLSCQKYIIKGVAAGAVKG
ncbi:MAG: carbohydrate ABC transporter permease [Lachnospiraceae bacterium]|jgi:hypothetical protein|nr:MAG: carbohydrate ABC transporter permease [Lachnospiraceae bacterium]